MYVEVLKGPAAVRVGPRTTGGALNMLSTPMPHRTGARLDVRAGETVLEVGERLGPAHLGMLASLGRSFVAVHRRVRVKRQT